MKLGYVAGPFRDHNTGPNGRYNFWRQDQNCNEAARVAEALWGFPQASIICPHLNTRPFQGSQPDEVWLAGDLEQVRRCDYVVLVPGWRESEGTKVEVAKARAWGLRIFEWDWEMMDAPELLADNRALGTYFVSQFMQGSSVKHWPPEE